MASGQRLNKEKTSIFFSRNTKDAIKRGILLDSGIHAANSIEKYLGVPALMDRSRRMAFMSVKDRIWSRISNWKNKFLSQDVNEILLKAVAQSNIPTNTTNIFLLPNTLLREINAMMQRYWWGSHDQVSKIYG
jgi:hypothetical protein